VVHHRLELGEVTPETHLDPRLPEVLCDPSQVQQIVTNLVLNAAEAMEGGVVTIYTKHLPADDEIQLSVQDTGTGISEENLTKLFDPFFSTKEEGKGTGLGLAVVYGLVEAHHGRIDLQTEVGRGTTFTVTLPVSGIEEKTEETAPTEDPGVK
jgi:signal transduction histidine kinase